MCGGPAAQEGLIYLESARLPQGFPVANWFGLALRSRGAKCALWWLFQLPEVGTREITSAPTQPEPPPLLRAAEIVVVNLHPGT